MSQRRRRGGGKEGETDFDLVAHIILLHPSHCPSRVGHLPLHALNPTSPQLFPWAFKGSNQPYQARVSGKASSGGAGPGDSASRPAEAALMVSTCGQEYHLRWSPLPLLEAGLCLSQLP